uniref:Bromodomain adjacent to zinc finger domain n=1 Tax=Echinococcus granulosus TaxID=6210 RepID=A0A068WFZ0_ECHGR|nr:bromodomain adjacent to zinc finger domain [Echinococcus granulosus]
MSVYHSTTSGQQNSGSASGATNGQSTADSAGKNNLALDYLASVFASNGTIPPTPLPQHSAASNLTPSTGDIMNALIAAAAAAAAATTTSSAASPSSMDPFTASTLLSSLMYSQQQQSTVVPSSLYQSPTDLYSPKSNLPLDPILFAHHALMQANFDASSRHHPTNHHQQQHQQQQQMALAMASLLGQWSSNPFLSLQQRRDLCSYHADSVEETSTTAAPTAGPDESFSSVLAKLTQGLNQSGSASTPSSASSRTPSSSHGQTKDSIVSTTSVSTSSSGVLTNTSRFPLQEAGENAAAFAAAAALTALQQQQQQQQQNRMAASKQSSHLSHRSTLLGTTLSREGHPHRGRGRPPKSSLALTRTPFDKPSRATTSTPQPESCLADSNSIDGTITDVLKRLNDSVDLSGSRKRRRIASTEKMTPSTASATAAVATTPTSSGAPVSTSKSDTSGHKRVRGFADSGYRLPLGLGWRRETLVKGVGPGGLLGDVVYIAPCGRQFWNIEGIREYLRSVENSILTAEDFTFKSYIRLGDYYECNKDSKGFVKMSEAAVNALITTGQDSPSRSHRRTPQAVFPPTSLPSTTVTATTSIPPTNTAAKSLSGLAFNPDLMAAMAAANVENYSKPFTDFHLALPRFPSLPPQLTAVLANQIGSLWSPWPADIQNTETSAVAASPPSTTSSTFALPSTQQQQQPQQKDRFSLQSSSLSSLEDFDRLRSFFTKLVEDHQRLENEKETQRKADLEAQTAKAREERVAYLVDEELRRPVEDLNVLNPKVLPEFDRIDGNRMPSQVFTDCLFVLEFLHAFTEVLCIDPETIPSMRCMQAAFIDRDDTCIEVINHLIIELLKFAILDPGIPTPRLVTQLLSQRFSEMEVNTQTVTGLLRVFLIGRNGYEDEMSDWLAPSNVGHLKDLSGPQLASLLAFICDELTCSSRIISNEVDRTIELQISLRRDKFNIEAKIRKIRVILARKFGLDHTVNSRGSEEENGKKQPAFLQSMRQLAPFQNYDSGDEDELNSVDELEKCIEELHHCLEAKQRAIEECSFRLSGLFLGQDRFYRNYFVLGSVGGIYVEGQPTVFKEGSAIRDVPPVFGPDAIVAEIKARRELSITRHFSTNSSSTSSNGVLTQKPNPLRSTSNPGVLITTKTEKQTAMSENEEVKNEETPLIENEANLEKKCELEEEAKIMEIVGTFTEESQEAIRRVKEVEKKEDKQVKDQEDDNLEEESVSLKSEERMPEKREDPEESTTWQPLDLSTKRSSPPPLLSLLPSQQSDLSLCQSLTEQDLASALDACQLDDTFLTTATLLYATQTETIDRSAIVGGWTDPSWHVQLLFYKLQLLRSIAFERRKNCENDEKALSTALRQLKMWLADSSLEGGEEWEHFNTSNANNVQFDDGEMAKEVERILKERKVQEAGPESLELIPADAKGNWWRLKGSEGLQTLLEALLPRGIRERGLAQTIQLSEEAVTSSIHVDPSTVLDLNSTSNSSEGSWKPRLLRVRSRRGKGRGANASSPLCSTSSAANLSALSSGRHFAASVSHISSATNLSEIAAGDVSTYAFHGDAENSLGATMERSVFLGENFERAMRAGRNSTNSAATTTAAEREFLDEYRFLELVEGLVDRVLSASLQTKGWQAPMKATEDDSIQIVPRDTPKVYRYDYWPLELARERLLDLEAHTERRYLLPPLNCESRLDAVQAQAAAAAAAAGEEAVTLVEGSGSVCSDSTIHEEAAATLRSHPPPPHIRRRVIRRSEREAEGEEGDGGSGCGGEGTSGEAQGLLLWRRSTRKADSVAELKRCAMQFEAAIAWDKSIMKVLCQICRRDKNEARLLLCDGCDHGYHTYCFRPPMISIPEGDWFCYDCVSKATGKCHCFVCGLAKPIGAAEAPSATAVEPAHRLVQCTSCARGAHPACLRPPLNRLPKRWTCMLCAASGLSGAVEKVGAAATATSEFQSPKKNNAPQAERPKRVYIKSGAYRSSKRTTKSKCESVKQRITEQQRKVGRPKGTSGSISSGGGCSSRRKDSSSLKKRGRPPGFYKRSHTETGGENEADDDGNDYDDDAEEEDTEYAGGDGEEESGGCGGGEERVTEASGDDGDGAAPVPLTNGIFSSRKFAATKRHGKSRKLPLGLTERNFCRHVTEDLMKHELSWPFRKPVCCKTIPIYRKVIKRPMDLSTILKRLGADKWNYYTSVAEWREDVRQIFKNCRIFNEDDSEIGKAGHELRRYFETNWAHISRLLNPGNASSPLEAPTGEDSVTTAPSTPGCQEPSTCTPSPATRPTFEVDDTPPLSHPLPPSSEGVEAPASPKSAEAPTEVEGVLNSPCAREAVVESIAGRHVSAALFLSFLQPCCSLLCSLCIIHLSAINTRTPTPTSTHNRAPLLCAIIIPVTNVSVWEIAHRFVNKA